MTAPRTLPLFDPQATPSSWNERMTPGEYAVYYSSFDHSEKPYCTVCSSLAEAESCAQEHIRANPSVRCRIYDHNGFIGRPIRELSGSAWKGESELSPRFRRWTGSLFLFGGIVLILIDWSRDFSLSWPAMIGVRMVFPGLLLLITEAFLLYARRRRSRERTDP